MAKKTPPKDLAQAIDARLKFKQGIDALADMVLSTLGPSGRVVVIEQNHGGPPKITKDGVTVARHIALADPVQDVAAQAVIQSAEAANHEAGDGTTTTVLYARAIYNRGLRMIEAGANPAKLRRGIEFAVHKLIDELQAMSHPVSESAHIEAVARCSANHDAEIGRVMAEVMNQIGDDGCVTIEATGDNEQISAELVTGTWFDRGLMDYNFLTNESAANQARRHWEHEDVLVLVSAREINHHAQWNKLLEKVVQAGKPLLVVAENVSGQAFPTLVVNYLQGKLISCPVRPPYYGERRTDLLQDIAAAVGTRMVGRSDGTDINDLDLTDLGYAKRVEVGIDRTIIVGGGGDSKAIAARCCAIRDQIETAPGDMEREALQERLSRLGGGMATITVGGQTETEREERRDLVEDAMHACKAAITEGFLPGGGTAVLMARASCSDAIDDELMDEDELDGAHIVLDILDEPLRTIASNAGKEPGVVLDKVLAMPLNGGYDALNDGYRDLVEAGILVPTRVECVALSKGASVAAQLLTSGGTVAFNREDQANAANDGRVGPRPVMR